MEFFFERRGSVEPAGDAGLPCRSSHPIPQRPSSPSSSPVWRRRKRRTPVGRFARHAHFDPLGWRPASQESNYSTVNITSAYGPSAQDFRCWIFCLHLLLPFFFFGCGSNLLSLVQTQRRRRCPAPVGWRRRCCWWWW